MVVTVTGGSGSGKSRMAEEISQALCGGRKLYIATMIVCDEESRKRMERHQRQRAGMYFETVERPFGLERLTFKEKERLILLECMSNLIANELYGGENFAMRDPKETKETIIRGIGHLREHAEHLVVVSNEMFRNGTYSVEMNDYLKVAGQVDRYLAGCSDIVIESVFGIPYFWKRVEETVVRERKVVMGQRGMIHVYCGDGKGKAKRGR